METETLPITIYFTLDEPGGTPTFSADPELEKVPWGTCATLVWSLQASGAAAKDATFCPKKGIYFVSSATYPAPWPNDQPTPVPEASGLQYQVEDPNVKYHKKDITYKYNVTVIADGKAHVWDPEDEDEGHGGV
ncbi:MAG: hypothetical protein AB7O67_04700 [Vicinamibacterales bacterium]